MKKNAKNKHIEKREEKLTGSSLEDVEDVGACCLEVGGGVVRL